MRSARFKNVLEIAIVIIFFSSFALVLLRPISDPDVFWHLKTGEWIWQNKALPDKDPFSFTTEYQSGKSVTALFILKQYWLAQLLIYWFYRLGGFYGIIAFRCFAYLGIVLLLYRWMLRQGVNRLTAMILLMPAFWFSGFWGGERPNILSFLFAVVVIYLLEDLKEGFSGQRVVKDKSIPYALYATRYTLLPAVMLIWSNMHAGFMIGDAIIVLYMIAEGMEIALNKIKIKAGAKAESEKTLNLSLNLDQFLFFSVCVIAILANVYRAIPTIFRVKETYSFYAGIAEMLSPFALAKDFGFYTPLLIIGFMILPLLLGIKRLKLRYALTTAFILFISLNSIRFIPFFVFISVIFIANVWGKSIDKEVNKITRFYVPHLCVIAFSAIIAAGMFNKTILKAPVVRPDYPEAAVEFIKRVKPEGELFNHYNAGGYLIWALYPEYRVFIDGRAISYEALNQYDKTLSGSMRRVMGIPGWKAVLDSYRVNMVLVPGVDIESGNFIPLVRRLVEDNEWSLVFVDNEMLLFVRDMGKNREIIRNYAVPKMLAYEKALKQAELYGIQHSSSWKSYATSGEINLYLGRREVALLDFETALKFNPSLRSTAISRLVEELRAGHDYSKLLDEIFG